MPASKSRARKRPATFKPHPDVDMRMPPVETPKVPWVEDRLNEPTAARSPLLPNRWWDHAGQAMEPQRQQPIIVVSHQVAEVLNMGIDRVVDVAARTKDNLEVTQGGLERYRREYEWLREFMRNVRDRIGPVEPEQSIIPEGGPQHFLEDLARSIDLLERGLPV